MDAKKTSPRKRARKGEGPGRGWPKGKPRKLDDGIAYEACIRFTADSVLALEALRVHLEGLKPDGPPVSNGDVVRYALTEALASMRRKRPKKGTA